MPTKSEVVASEVTNLLRARTPILWVVTNEEARVEGYLASAAASANYTTKYWDAGQGLTSMDGEALNANADIGDVLRIIEDSNSTRTVWVLKGVNVWLENGLVSAVPVRQFCNLGRKLPTLTRNEAQAVIVISKTASVPDDLVGVVTIIEWPLPDADELAKLLDDSLEVLPADMREQAIVGMKTDIIVAAGGMTGVQASRAFAKSVVSTRKIDPVIVAQDKKRIVSGIDGLTWYDPLPGGMDAIGGLDVLKGWLISRKSAYTPSARAYGLKMPSGAVLVGVPGCGKSLTPQAIATFWGVPLLKLDMGALKSKFVGDSERKLREVFKIVETIGRCVLWLDEIEKAMAGATDGSADGGVSSDALGYFLTWMQERQGGAFVIATANDVSRLPPELTRAGRFDKVFFVDLPNVFERADILISSLRRRRPSSKWLEIDLKDVADATPGFSGAEMAAIVDDAMYLAFEDGEREVATADMLKAAGSIRPRTPADMVERLRKWSQTNAELATTPIAANSQKSGAHQIDF